MQAPARLERYLEARREEVDRAIREIIEASVWDVPALKDAICYSVFGGKRLRSIILLSVYGELSASRDEPMDFAAAVEMIQAYSLVHDDLPCMDDDDYRRGKLSCHKKFGEALALLCGDALLTMAFETMLSCKVASPDKVLRAALELATAAGPGGMVGGQVLDLQLEGQTGSACRVSKMYQMKTGALFEGSAKAGAILAGAPSDIVERAASWGRFFGYAYQVLDDIQDADLGGTEEAKGTLLKTLSLSEVCDKASDALEMSIQAASTIGHGHIFLRLLSQLYLGKAYKLRQRA